MDRRRRLGFAGLAALFTVTLYAEGVLKNGWIEVALLAPVVWFLATPKPAALLQNLLLSFLTLCFALSGLDLLLRPAIGHRLHYTPSNIFTRKLPNLPILARWDSNVTFVGEAYGDLAAIAGDPKLREPRPIVFETDAAGFRNNGDRGPVEMLVLGDSFGAGIGTTQERMFSQLLETQYGRQTYNLSFPGGPYDQYLTFAIEWPRLAVAPRSTLIWALYTGNDLDDAGGETWDLAALPWKNGFAAWLVRYRTFRNRSPLNQLMEGLRLRLRSDTGGVVIRMMPNGRPMLFYDGHEVWGTRSRLEVERHPNFVKLERTLAAMKTLAEERKVDVTILILPTKGEIYRWILDQRPPRPEDAESSGFAQAVLAACQRVRLRCLDVKPHLVKEARRLFDTNGTLLWWRDDTHLNGCGHEAVAAFIAREVLASGSHSRARIGSGNGCV